MDRLLWICVTILLCVELAQRRLRNRVDRLARSYGLERNPCESNRHVIRRVARKLRITGVRP